MLILNFTHPLTQQQQEQIEQITGIRVEEIRTIPVQIEQSEPLGPQVVAIVDAVGLTQEEWQTRTVLINPPGYAPAAFVLLAEVHGRSGHFPNLVRVRPKQGPIVTYEVAEILNLQQLRDEARRRRFS